MYDPALSLPQVQHMHMHLAYAKAQNAQLETMLALHAPHFDRQPDGFAICMCVVYQHGRSTDRKSHAQVRDIQRLPAAAELPLRLPAAALAGLRKAAPRPPPLWVRCGPDPQGQFAAALRIRSLIPPYNSPCNNKTVNFVSVWFSRADFKSAFFRLTWPFIEGDGTNVI